MRWSRSVRWSIYYLTQQEIWLAARHVCTRLGTKHVCTSNKVTLSNLITSFRPQVIRQPMFGKRTWIRLKLFDLLSKYFGWRRSVSQRDLLRSLSIKQWTNLTWKGQVLSQVSKSPFFRVSKTVSPCDLQITTCKGNGLGSHENYRLVHKSRVVLRCLYSYRQRYASSQFWPLIGDVYRFVVYHNNNVKETVFWVSDQKRETLTRAALSGL